MKIRLANKDDREKIIDIWNYCFRDPKEYVDFYFENVYSNENTLVCENGGKILSSLQLNQYVINVRGVDFPVSYVVGVSTLPEFRGKGMMKRVMEEMFDEMKTRGQHLAILMPIDTRLYRRFGFENCYDILTHAIEIKDLHNFRAKGEFVELKEVDISRDLIDIYSKSMKNLNGYTIKDEDYFLRYLRDMKSEGGYVYVNYIDGIAQSIISYYINGDEMNVRNLYAVNNDALKSALGFIFSHNTQVKNVEITQDIRSKIPYLISNHRFLKTGIGQFMMGRVIDLGGTFEDLQDFFDEDIAARIKLNSNVREVKFKVSDDYIEDNNVQISLNIEGDRLYYIISRDGLSDNLPENAFGSGFTDNLSTDDIRSSLSDNLPDDVLGSSLSDNLSADKLSANNMVSISINELATLIFGYKSVFEIDGFKSLSDDEKKMIDVIFPRCDNYIDEYV